MIKKISTYALAAALAATGTLAISTTAQAREGTLHSVGNGVKCMNVAGVLVCFRGI